MIHEILMLSRRNFHCDFAYAIARSHACKRTEMRRAWRYKSYRILASGMPASTKLYFGAVNVVPHTLLQQRFVVTPLGEHPAFK